MKISLVAIQFNFFIKLSWINEDILVYAWNDKLNSADNKKKRSALTLSHCIPRSINEYIWWTFAIVRQLQSFNCFNCLLKMKWTHIPQKVLFHYFGRENSISWQNILKFDFTIRETVTIISTSLLYIEIDCIHLLSQHFDIVKLV